MAGVNHGHRVLLGGVSMRALAVMVVGLTLVGVTHAYNNDDNDVAQQGNPKAPKLFFGDFYCKVVCQKSGVASGAQCQQCLTAAKGDTAKRTVRGRRFDDFGLDDYLFMRLLGRNLEDNN